MAHIVGLIGEALLHLVLNGQGFDGLGTHDALVEIAGDPGIDLPDLPVYILQPLLEDGKEDHQHRNGGQDHQRQPCVHTKHHEHNAHQIGDAPGAVDQGPADQTADTARIAHETGVDIAHTVLIDSKGCRRIGSSFCRRDKNENRCGAYKAAHKRHIV